MAPTNMSHGKGQMGWAWTGTGKSSKHYFYRGRKCNLHGTLVVGMELVFEGFRRRIHTWYKNHQLYVWFWLVFFTWVTLGCMFGLMVYAVMP